MYKPMKARVCVLLPFILALCGAARAAGQPPKLRLSEVEDIALTRTRLDLTLDPAKDKFSGVTVIQAELRRPAETVWLNGTGIAIQAASAAAAGKTWQATPVAGGSDFVGLSFGAALPAGAVEITIRYQGTIRQQTSGIFHVQDRGIDYLLTQFENTDARDAFPCFDEPSYKAPWQVTLHVPAGDSAVSNTPVASDKTEGATRTYVFRETKPLPSYLVAFGVGPFEFVDGGVAGKNRVPVRIVTPKGRANEARYAAAVTATILTRLEEYFGIPYPYEKSDQVVVPVTVAFGAMENAGMVTYNQNFILSEPASDTIPRQRQYASVAAHELAHQWFGDLVTTNWWDDIWLNEAFATWMEQKLIAEWKPEWETRVGDVNTKLGAEERDSLVTARKIRQEIRTKDDISNAFDDITYSKGAAVIGMFENWMGPADFRKGVQLYLSRHAFGNATADDFLASLESVTKKPVARAFATFLNQPGTPLVSVALDCSQKPPALHLQQERLLPTGSKGAAGEAWNIPICMRYGPGGGPAECALMTEKKYDWPLRSARGCPAWVEANAAGRGYYAVDYRGGLLAPLARGAAADLHPAERVDLIGNVASLADAGKLPMADALGFVPAFHDDPQRFVVSRAIRLALSIWPDLVPQDMVPNYRRFLARNFQARARQLGWLPKAGEAEDARLLRPTLVADMGMWGADMELVGQARSLAEKWLQDHNSVPPEVSGAVLRTAAEYGDAGLFQRYLAAFRQTQNRQEKQRLLNAMASFHDRAAIHSALEAVLTKQIPLVDGFVLLISSGQSYLDTRKLAFEFIRDNLNRITAGNPSIFGNDLGFYLPYSAQTFCDAGSRREVEQFFTPVVARYTGAPRNLAQVLEGIDLCIARKAAREPGVVAFLKSY